MPRSRTSSALGGRTSPAQWIAIAAGVALAAVGLVRLAQGRPDRSSGATRFTNTANTASTTVASADVGVTVPESTAGAGGAPGAESDAPATEVKVDILNFAFAPDPLTIKAGTKVTWTNKDAFAHTATSDDGTTFDSGNLDEGQSYSFTFTKPGTYTYKCAIHNSMTGTVVVT